MTHKSTPIAEIQNSFNFLLLKTYTKKPKKKLQIASIHAGKRR